MALELREKRLLMIPVALAAVLGFYSWVHAPLMAKRAEAENNLAKVSADLKRDQARLSGEGNLAAREQTVEARERVIDSWVPGKNSAALFIWYLSQAELHSGAHITGLSVGERKLVTAGSQQQVAQPAAQPGAQPGTQPGAQPGAEPDAQPGAQQGAQPAAQPGAQSGAQPGANVVPTLAVLQINLKVDARFAQHLLFNQALEEMPLFLNADAVSLDKGGLSPSDQVGKLVAEGNTRLAGQMLSASPNLNGTYQINLYFKQDKAGPTTDPMKFSGDAGKNDPFVMDGVDEFLSALVDYYKAAAAASRAASNRTPGSTPNASVEQQPPG